MSSAPGWGKLALAGGLGALVGGGAVTLSSGATGRIAVEKTVRDYLLANPELVTEAQARLQERETAKLIDANRGLIEMPFGSAWAGAADGDVVLVEFFDYSCGYCRQSSVDVERLLAEDPKLEVVWREWPVLGDDSMAAAEASLAAAEQGKFRPFFHQPFASGRPTVSALQAVAGRAGVTASAGSPRYREELGKNHEIARVLGATGTPTFVVGDTVLQGAVGYDALKAAIEEARARA